MPCEKPLLSIIVPVYKVENYLQKCIDSILAQTFTDFELILVEDGSPDGCPALCDAAAAKDARIRVLHQKNGGLSAARNAGLDVARGEWIGFVDSDDYIAPEMYETLYKAVQNTGADLALCDYAAVDEAGIPCLPPYTGLAQRIFTGRELLKRATNTMAQPAWNKLYRRAIFAQLRYPEGKLNEDIAGSLQNQITEVDERLAALEHMTLKNLFTVPVTIDNTGTTLLADDLGNAIVADWKYKEE